MTYKKSRTFRHPYNSNSSTEVTIKLKYSALNRLFASSSQYCRYSSIEKHHACNSIEFLFKLSPPNISCQRFFFYIQSKIPIFSVISLYMETYPGRCSVHQRDCQKEKTGRDMRQSPSLSYIF